MDLLTNLSLFIRIVEKGGLAAAGRDFGFSPASVSERVNALEDHYGARLLTRTTRAISLTDEGRTLLDGSRQLVSEATDLRSQVRHGADHLSGRIRISATFDLGRNRIDPIINSFIKQHPDIEIDFLLSDGYVDLVGQGIDLAVRYGKLSDSSLKRRKLGDIHRFACAAPSYLAKHGEPASPADLVDHNCLVMRFGNQPEQEWPFTISGKRQMVQVRGNRTSNEGALIRQWAAEGYGICMKSHWDLEEDIKAGRLVPILTDFAPPPNDLQLVYTAGRSMPRRVRCLMNAISAYFGDRKVSQDPLDLFAINQRVG